MNPFREEAGALGRAMHSLERLAQLDVRLAVSGHRGALTDPPAAFKQALKHDERWIGQPEKVGWHASKRIFTSALMFHQGIMRDHITDCLLGCPWFGDYSRSLFHREPAEFVPRFLEEMLRSGAARWHGERLVASATEQETSLL